MARPLRLEYPGAVWHVTSRGHNKQDIYFSDDDRALFTSMLADAVRRYGWILHEYTMMTNHYHLVIETPTMTLSRGMKWLNSKYAQRFNRIHDRCGSLFQGRFKGFLVDKETYLLELMRYVALNPVRAGMVKRPEDYKWNSYRATAGYDPPSEWAGSSWTLNRFGVDRESQQLEYRKFVDAGAHITRSPLEDRVRIQDPPSACAPALPPSFATSKDQDHATAQQQRAEAWMYLLACGCLDAEGDAAHVDAVSLATRYSDEERGDTEKKQNTADH